MNSGHYSGNSSNGFPCASSLSSFLFGFSVSGAPCDRFHCTSSLIFSLLVDSGYSFPAMKMWEK